MPLEQAKLDLVLATDSADVRHHGPPHTFACIRMSISAELSPHQRMHQNPCSSTRTPVVFQISSKYS